MQMILYFHWAGVTFRVGVLNFNVMKMKGGSANVIVVGSHFFDRRDHRWDIWLLRDRRNRCMDCKSPLCSLYYNVLDFLDYGPEDPSVDAYDRFILGECSDPGP